jgi:Planctomycete cytochrome C
MDVRQIQPTNMKKSTSLFLAAAAILALTPLITRADDDEKLDPGKLPPAATKTGVTYDADIKPILDTSCIKCHKGEKPRAKLRLDTLDNILKGGKEGKVVVPGDLTKSPLVFAVAHVGDDEDDFMPPPVEKSKIQPLTADQVGLIRAWVEQGAK